MRKSTNRQPRFRGASLSAAQQRHSLLLSMAADLERLREQGERIRELRASKQDREGRRITQETAATEIGVVTIRQYRTWEKPGADMQFENLRALADYYGTTTDYIQYGAGHTPGALSPSATPAPDLMGGLAAGELAQQLNRIEDALDDLKRELAELRDRD